MTLLEQELRDMSTAQLRDLIVHLDEVHKAGGTAALLVSPVRSAARTELESRPNGARGEAFLQETFPQRPSFSSEALHAPGCTCCGAGVKQWR